MWHNGAEGGTRTPTSYLTRPSNVRVCQFRHFGLICWDDCHPENPSRGDAVTTDCSLGHEEKPTSSSFPDLPLASHQSTTLHLYPGKNCCSGKQPPKVTQRSRERLLPQAKAAAPGMARSQRQV